jgi:hypothetical protein
MQPCTNQLEEIWKITSIFLKMEDNLKKIMQPKTIKGKNNNIFENGRQPQFLNKEDNLNFLNKEDDHNIF